MKRKNGISDYLLSGSVLTYSFGSAGVVELDAASPALFPGFPGMTECQQRVIVNGLKQRLCDGIGGADRPAAERYAKMSAIADNLRNGVYSARAVAAPTLTDAILAAAISIVSGKPLPSIVAFLAGKTAAEKAAIAENPRWKGKIGELLAERTRDVDVDELDAEIDAIQ